MVPTRAKNSVLDGFADSRGGRARVERGDRFGSKIFRSQIIRNDCRSRAESERASRSATVLVSRVLKTAELVSTEVSTTELVSATVGPGRSVSSARAGA